MNNQINDKPFRSRKFFLTVFCILLLTTVCVLGIWFPMLPAILPTFVGGILGILSLYFTGNVLQKHVETKNIKPVEYVEVQSISSPPIPKPENPDEEGEI